MKLSIRLQSLKNMVADDYKHIWDTCCDHGYLGISLLTSNNATIHFVDTVAHIIDDLSAVLSKNCEHTNQYKTYVLDAKKLPITNYADEKQLVIIAGVGGDLTAEIFEALTQASTKHHSGENQSVDFLLCPVHRIYELRNTLIQHDIRIKDEILINENNRFYEALMVTTDKNHRKVSPIGEKLWQVYDQQQTESLKAYLQQTITHYKKVKKGFEQKHLYDRQQHIQSIIDEYQSIKIK